MTNFLYVTNINFAQIRSSHRRCSVRKFFLRNFAKFTGKNLCQSLYFNKAADLSPATLSKQRLLHRCFPVNFAKFLRTPFLQNTSVRLLLKNFVKVIKMKPAYQHSASVKINNCNRLTIRFNWLMILMISQKIFFNHI